ncbi:MAG: hypothetical protein MI919_36595 [Holophagales bacterium]|nr:hypothetical protein [Holophagales bacterium]
MPESPSDEKFKEELQGRSPDGRVHRPGEPLIARTLTRARIPGSDDEAGSPWVQSDTTDHR